MSPVATQEAAAVMNAHLTRRKPAKHYSPTAVVSPGELRGLLLACRMEDLRPSGSPPLATPWQMATRERLKTRALDFYIQQDPPRRIHRQPVLIRFCMNGGDAKAAAIAFGRSRESDIRIIQGWAAGFLGSASDFISRIEQEMQDVREVLEREAQESRTLKDDLDTYCKMTHGESGGSGRTPAIGRAEHMARLCAACSLRSALFGPLGWGDQ